MSNKTDNKADNEIADGSDKAINKETDNKINIKSEKKDKEQKKSQYLVMALFMLLYMLIGAVCGALMVFSLKPQKEELSFGQFMGHMLILIAFMYAAMLLQIIIHEAGHLIFGLLSGYKFLSFRVANMMWVRENGKIRFRKLSLEGTGGQCLMSPPDMEGDRLPVLLYNLGGCLMNLISIPIFIVAYIPCRKVPYLPMFFLVMAVIGGAYAFMNGIPLRLGIINNDGCNAKELCRSEKARRSMWIQMKVAEQIAKGVRMKDMPKEWFYLPEDYEMGNSMIATMAVFYENRLMDELAFDRVKELIDRLMSMDTAIVGIHKSLLVCDRLFCELISDKSSDIKNSDIKDNDIKSNDIIKSLRTKEQLKFMKQMRNFPSVMRTEYAYALLYEKDASKAGNIEERFEKCAGTYPYKVDIESERELMQLAKVRLNETESCTI